MPRYRRISSRRPCSFFSKPSANHSSLNSERFHLHTIGRMAPKHAWSVSKSYLRLIKALVEDTAKGIRKLKRILVPMRNENG